VLVAAAGALSAAYGGPWQAARARFLGHSRGGSCSAHASMDVEQGVRQKFRCKLYALSEHSVWSHAGTGHTSIGGSGDNRRLIFKDEESGETLHDRPVYSKEVYQLQGEGDRETIIVWEDMEDARDWALSFQDPDGTTEIYELICNDPEVAESKRLLPLPKIANLPELGRKLQFVPPSQREPVAAECISPKFLSELRETFHNSEDLNSAQELTDIFAVAKGIFLLSNQKLTERYMKDDVYEDVLGMLECDPSLPAEKRIHHREVIKSKVKFNDVLSFEDADTLDKIHLNYRLLYLKDIVLPRTLDDASFASLVQMIHTNLAVILDQLLKSEKLLEQLLDQVKKQDVQSLLFLQDACRLSRQIPPMQRQALYDQMVEKGLFEALAVYFGELSNSASDTADVGVRHPKEHPARHHAVEVLLLHVTCDPSSLRNFLTRERDGSEAGQAVLRALIQLMLHEEDQGVQGQISELLRAIMDPTMLEGREKDGRLDVFYEHGAFEELVAILRPEGRQSTPQVCFAKQLACEIVAFAIARHGYRAKVFVIRQEVAQHAVQLLSAPQRFLQLAAVRVLRAIVGTKDEAYLRYIISNKLLTPVMKCFEENLAPPSLGINLMASAVLELLEYIRTENLKIMVDHICKNYGSLLQLHASKLKTLEGLLLKHQQNLEYEAFPPDQHSAGGPMDGSDGRPGQRRMRSPGRDESGEDESYFETLDDDENEDKPQAAKEELGQEQLQEAEAAGADEMLRGSDAGLPGLLGGYADEEEEAPSANGEAASDGTAEEATQDSLTIEKTMDTPQTEEAAEPATTEETSSERSLGYVSKRLRTSESSDV